MFNVKIKATWTLSYNRFALSSKEKNYNCLIFMLKEIEFSEVDIALYEEKICSHQDD